MNILVVNDDGIHSPGLRLLASSFMEYGRVSVLAPHSQQSAIGHGITIHEPIRLHEQPDWMTGVKAWSLEGKPADCVKFALYGLNLDIDLVVSGINDGPNLGTDIIYSGTLAGASEGVICGKPAIAFSADFGSLDLPKRELPELLPRLMNPGILSSRAVLNINFPQKSYTASKGIRITDMGDRPFIHEFALENGVYWARGTWDEVENREESDVWAYENGYISLSAIQINRTDYVHMETLRTYF